MALMVVQLRQWRYHPNFNSTPSLLVPLAIAPTAPSYGDVAIRIAILRQRRQWRTMVPSGDIGGNLIAPLVPLSTLDRQSIIIVASVTIDSNGANGAYGATGANGVPLLPSLPLEYHHCR
jgi:hypothetical protein